MLKELERRVNKLQRGSGYQKYHLRLNDGSYLDITIREILKTFFDAIKIINIIEFCEPRPPDFDEMFEKVKTLANIVDEELVESESELCIAVWHCREAVSAKPLTIEERRQIERSFCTTEQDADKLEAANLMEWQRAIDQP
jgi:hypothetical protein